MPCLYSNKHTLWQHELEEHLSKCPHRKIPESAPFYEEGVNQAPDECNSIAVAPSQLDLISAIEDLYARCFPNGVSDMALMHTALYDRLWAKSKRF